MIYFHQDMMKLIMFILKIKIVTMLIKLKNFNFQTFKNKINDLIRKNNLNTSFNDLIIFIKEAIEGREYLKFLFTKHLSKILNYVEEL